MWTVRQPIQSTASSGNHRPPFWCKETFAFVPAHAAADESHAELV